MADFCLECIGDVVPELVGTGLNDLAGLCEPGEMVWALCEGCGAGWFDVWGRRVTPVVTTTPSRAEIMARMSEALAAVQAAQTAMHQLCQVSDLAMWANGLNEQYSLKYNLDTELALIEDAQSEPAPTWARTASRMPAWRSRPSPCAFWAAKTARAACLARGTTN